MTRTETAAQSERAAHTPGPWTAEPASRGSELIETRAVTDEDLPYLIACPGSGGAMSYSSTVCHLHWTGTPEWAANARLIAAAPDLYEALKAVVAIADRKTDEFDRARAALAKAEGTET